MFQAHDTTIQVLHPSFRYQTNQVPECVTERQMCTVTGARFLVPVTWMEYLDRVPWALVIRTAKVHKVSTECVVDSRKRK